MNAPSPSPPKSDFEFSPLKEIRALFEIASCYAYLPTLRLAAPKGDGHPVMAIPGFMSGDGSTTALRAFLRSLGYDARGWGPDRNTSFDDTTFAQLADAIEALAAEKKTKVSLIGHSLGGIYARVLAHEIPHAVRQVILLGAAFNVDDRAEVDTALSKLYERLNPVERTSDLLSERTLRRATPVPSTAIYSKGDGIVPWYCCIEPEDESTENVGVPGTHIGMPFNPVILYAIADRLQQPQDDWKPFSIGGMWQFLYGSPDPA